MLEFVSKSVDESSTWADITRSVAGGTTHGGGAMIGVARTFLIASILFGLYYANYVNGWVGVEDINILARR